MFDDNIYSVYLCLLVVRGKVWYVYSGISANDPEDRTKPWVTTGRRGRLDYDNDVTKPNAQVFNKYNSKSKSLYL